MNQTQSQTALPTTDKYRAGLARGVWKRDRNEGEALIPTDAELLSVSPDHFHLEAPGFDHLRKFNSKLCTAIGRSIREGGPMGKNEAMKKFKKQSEDGIVLQRFSLFTGMLQQAASSKTVPDNMVDIYKYLQDIWDKSSEIINILNSHGERKIPPLPHPLEYAMRAWQQEQKRKQCLTISDATVDHVNKLSTTPYAISEVNRRKWEIEGSVDAIEVDGEPIITHIKQLPGTLSDDDVKVLTPKGTKGELMPMPTQRDNMETPIPLLAYQKYGKNLGSPIASDTAQIMTLAYAVNEPLILSVEEGASLLARGEDGKFRPPRASDEQRFENAYACLYNMTVWITDERGINRFYPLAACDRFSDNRVSIAAAGWARERKLGRWTLTAGGGTAGQNRLKGDAHNNNVWRVITGIEYWLARGRFSRKGPNAKISQALIPASGTNGPGNWYTLSWQDLMMIAGDIWDQKDKEADKRAYKRFYTVRETLTQNGYQVKNLHRAAEAGDTVEFLFKKKRGRGGAKVMVRATARFVEGARKSKREDWQTVNLSNWIGL